MNPGRYLILAGLFLTAMGLLLALMGILSLLIFRSDLPGRLPLDFVVSKGNVRIYVLLGTSLVLSFLLTLLINILFTLGKR